MLLFKWSWAIIVMNSNTITWHNVRDNKIVSGASINGVVECQHYWYIRIHLNHCWAKDVHNDSIILHAFYNHTINAHIQMFGMFHIPEKQGNIFYRNAYEHVVPLSWILQGLVTTQLRSLCHSSAT